jgi:predicted nucleic acid-binding protein
MVAWDTTVVSRLSPGGPLERHLLDRAQAGEPVATTAPTVMEIVRGIETTAVDRPHIAPALDWFVRLVTSALLEILPLDRAAAIVAGRIRALHPAPPTGARRRAIKPEVRAGWVLDIQIAACAWIHGREIATENTRDFEALRDLIARLYPGAPALGVTPAPTI